MRNFFLRIVTALNALTLRLSGGRVGSQAGNLTVLLLHTVGRRSGKRRATPIAYFRTDGSYFLIASNWGNKWNAGWYYNLMHQPRATIQIGSRMIPVEAREVAPGEEYDRFWEIAVARYPGYLQYKKTADRHIPIVLLTPIERLKNLAGT